MKNKQNKPEIVLHENLHVMNSRYSIEGFLKKTNYNVVMFLVMLLISFCFIMFQ